MKNVSLCSVVKDHPRMGALAPTDTTIPRDGILSLRFWRFEAFYTPIVPDFP